MSNLIKNPSIGAELIQANRRTDIHDEACSNFANAPKKLSVKGIAASDIAVQVCIYIYIYIYIHTHTYIHKYVRT